MEQPTYDPILESRPLTRFRLLNPLRPPRPGTALVLAPHHGVPLTVRDGEPIPDARYGSYQHMFLVDLAEHPLFLDITLPSRDPAFAFQSRVGLVCRVAEPTEVVRRDIRDMSGAMKGHFKWLLRDVTRNYDIGEFHEAERALNAKVRAFSGDSAIRLRNLHVELLIDEDEAASSGRTYRDTTRRLRLESMVRDDRLAKLHADGVEGLLAEVYERQGALPALEWIHSIESEERKELLDAWDVLWKHTKGEREPWEVVEAERFMRERLTGRSGAPFGGVRSGRLRGALLAGGTDEDSTDRGERRDDRDRYIPDADAATSSRPDFVADAPSFGGGESEDYSGAADGPPEDEPPGDREGGATWPTSRLRGVPQPNDDSGRDGGHR